MSAPSRRFTIILEPEEGGGYSVHCPALPGCASQGDDRQAALSNIKEAINLVLGSLEHDESVVGRTLAAIEGKNVPPNETPNSVADEIKEVLKARYEDGLPLTIETVVVEVTSPVSA